MSVLSIQLNGEVFECERGSTLMTIVKSLALENKRYAIEHNEQIVPKSEHATLQLMDGDRVEVVQAIGGG